MIPTARNEYEIERAIDYARKVLNAAENSNQHGEDVIVLMAKACAMYRELQLSAPKFLSDYSDSFAA